MKKVLILNETVFICMLSIVVYGLYGVMSPNIDDLDRNATSWFYLLLPIMTTLAYLVLQKGKESVLPEFTLLLLDKKTLFKVMLAILMAFAIPYLISQSLTGDELFYANYGFIHSITMLPIVSVVIPNIQNVDASVVARIFSFSLLASLGVLAYLLLRLGRINYYLLCIVALTTLVFMRLTLVYLGGNPVIHAPLTGAYTMLFGTIFGISDLALQSGQFLAYISFGYFVFTKFRAALSRDWLGLLVTFSFFSIPGFFFLGSVVEPAIWTVMCYSVVLMSLVDEKFIKYKPLVYLIVGFSFFRLAAIFSIVPLLIHFVINGGLKGDIKNKLESFINVFSPVLIFVPFFVFAYSEGSAATSGHVFSLSRLLEITVDGTMWSAYSDVLSPFWLVLYLLLVVIKIRSSFTQINIIFFCFLSVIFFSLNESVWSFAKYRLEVFIPLFMSQVLFFVKEGDSRRFAIAVFGIIGVSININSVLGFPDSCSQKQGILQNHDMRYKVDFGCKYLTRVPYNFSKVMSYVKSKDGMAATYIPGVYYGAFMHIIHGTTTADYLISQKIWDEQELLNSESLGDTFSANPESIHMDRRIEYVMLGFTKNLSVISSSLISRGWKAVYTHTDKYGPSVFLLQRPIGKDLSVSRLQKIPNNDFEIESAKAI